MFFFPGMCGRRRGEKVREEWQREVAGAKGACLFLNLFKEEGGR